MSPQRRGGSPTKSEYQSLKKYLDNTAKAHEQSMEAIDESQMKSINRLNSQKKALSKEQFEHFTPQYNTLTKVLKRERSSKTQMKKDK